MSIAYNVRQVRGITVVDLDGKITAGETLTSASGSGPTLHEFIRDLLTEGHKDILLNLRGVSHIDSSGIGELFACLTTLQNQGGALKLTNPNERVKNLLSLTKLNTVLEVIQDESAAVQSFSSAGAA
ncbi:MAG TPA: STAS domain-containing protein [Terriglobales bacterium]|nr:STAS domain-containing protein [Terriglobales bacterium]